MKSTNIAWISDIHYKKEYYKDADFNIYVGHFIKKLVTINESDPIGIIIFTGDISFSSHALEYTYFEEEFLIPLQEKFKDIPIITIPGNHDVSWDKVKTRILDNIGSGTKFIDRKKHIDPEIFSDYTAFFHRSNNISNKEDIFTKLSENNTDGYIFFEKKNLLFLLINSCNLSFGRISTSIEGFSIHELKVGGIKTKVLVSQERMISELGNQTYSLEDFPFDEVNSIIEKHKPTVITMAHHPPNWLHWSELNSNKLHDSKIFYKKLIQASDILLVGHEHSTINIGDRIGDKSIMLKAGAFLDLPEGNGQLSLSNNWFSILKIKPNLIERTQYFYCKDDVKSWHNNKVIKYQIKKSNYIASKDPANIKVSSPVPKLMKVNLRETGVYNSIKQKIEFEKSINLDDVTNQKIGKINFCKVTSFNKVRLIILNLDDIWANNESTEITEDLFEIIRLIKYQENEEIIISLFDFYTLNENGKIIQKEFHDLSTDEQVVTNHEIKKLRNAQRLKYHSFKHHFFMNLSDDKDLFRRLCDVKITHDLSHLS